MPDLAAQFRGLSASGTRSDAENRFVATRIEGFESHRLGVDSRGLPCLLLSVAATDDVESGPPIVLAHVQMQENVECRVSEPDGTNESGRFTLIRCTDSDPTLREYFLEVSGAIVVLLGSDPHGDDVRAAVDRLIELFRAIDAPPRKSIQGLWTELFVMAEARDVRELIRAWHVVPEDRFDFNAGTQRVEVKGAGGRVRKHHFSLEQLLPIGGVEVLIASVLLERAAGGTSIAELVTRIRSRAGVEPALVVHLDRVVALCLGAAWREGLSVGFDEQLARSSLMFFEQARVPRPSAELPPTVSHVRFVADLTALESAGEETRSRGGLFGALP